MSSMLIAEFRKPKSDLYIAAGLFLVFLRYVLGFVITGGYEPWIANILGRGLVIDVLVCIFSIIIPFTFTLRYFKTSLSIYEDKILFKDPLSKYTEIEIAKENYVGYYLKKTNEKLSLFITQKDSRYQIKFETKNQIPEVIAILEQYYKPTN